MKHLMILLACLVVPVVAAGQQTGQVFDSLMQELFAEEGPGGVAMVARDGQVLYRKAFGKANLELDVDMAPEHIFRIGSNTKQFTAAAILKLRDEGKLNLEDDITTYIEDFPTHGHTITIKHLLTHTSGIKSYTGMPEFTREVQKKDLTPLELIDFFKNQPMDFKPGDEYMYNNSAYSMLGYVVEVVSGKTYEHYISENFFVPLGMADSYYGSPTRIIKNRAAGYSKRDTLYINAPYLSMTQPYAAGALLSTVDDMYRWYTAVMEDRVISRASRLEAQSTFHLNDGRKTGYGYGWGIGNIQGSPMISHSGGINGYLTHTLYLPEEKLFAAVFSNCDRIAPGETGIKMAAIAIGKPYRWKKIQIPDKTLQSYEGVYASEHDGDRTITYSEGKLYSMRSGSSRYEIFPYDEDKFFFEEGITTLQFHRDSDNTISSVVSKGTGYDITWVKTDKPIPELDEIELDESTRLKYTGKYELTPDFHISIFTEGQVMYAQATGQDRVEIKPVAPDRFALVNVDAQLTFNMDDQGEVVSLTLHQNGEHLAKKVE